MFHFTLIRLNLNRPNSPYQFNRCHRNVTNLNQDNSLEGKSLPNMDVKQSLPVRKKGNQYSVCISIFKAIIFNKTKEFPY